jgi:hypothetical protein
VFFYGLNLEDYMLGKILGYILLVLIGLFCICSCKVASWADQEMEEELRKKDQDEKKNL